MCEERIGQKIDKMVQTIRDELGQRIPIEMENPKRGTSKITNVTENSIVYIRGNSRLYMPIDLVKQTAIAFNGKGEVTSRILKEYDKRYANKSCHCTFFMMLLERYFPKDVTFRREPQASIRFSL